VGYDLTPDYLPLIGTDVSNEMHGVRSSVYIRVPFFVPDASLYSDLTFRMKYDDGFVAYLNGVEIASRLVPSPVVWTSTATSYHDDLLAVVFEEISLPDGDDLLITGTNVLAIHGMNNVVGSSDLLFLPELEGAGPLRLNTEKKRYFQQPTPGATNGTGSVDLGPIIGLVSNTPAIPSAEEDLFVTATVTEGTADVVSVAMRYRVMFSGEVAVTMYDDGAHGDGGVDDDVYGAVIPAAAYSEGEMIRYCVQAVDDAQATSRWSLASDNIEYLGTVVDDPSLTNQLPVLHWFVENPGWYTNEWGANNRNWTNACLFYEGRFYDNVQVRVRGGTAAWWVNPPFKFDFHKGHYFTYSTNHPPAEEINIISRMASSSPDVVAFRARASSPKGGEDLFVRGDYKGHLSAWGETIDLYDVAGTLISSMTYTGAPSDQQRYLRITEFMYDPRDPPSGPYEDGHFEYIELKNTSSNTLDLTDVHVSVGIQFAFTNGVTNLGPGELLVLARNPEAFATRYDTNSITVVGPYEGRLSNNGEELKLEDASNETILAFNYSDGWCTNTDGHGYSLTIVDPEGDYDTWGASNRWRSSAVFDGSSGWDDREARKIRKEWEDLKVAAESFVCACEAGVYTGNVPETDRHA